MTSTDIKNRIPSNSQQLVLLIMDTRKQMIKSAFSKGFSSPETVQISQQLDYYLNLEIKQRS